MWIESRYDELKEFHTLHGHANVPFKPSTPLRSWLSRVKTAYTESLEGGAATDLTDDRIAKLESLGVVMKKQERLPFEVQLSRWISYRDNHDGRDPPSTHQIGNWISGLRRKYVDKNNGKVTNLTQGKLSGRRDDGNGMFVDDFSDVVPLFPYPYTVVVYIYVLVLSVKYSSNRQVDSGRISLKV